MFSNKIDNTFHCPDGFEKETINAQLFYEDLDKNSELWLVRVPHDFDPSVIENQEIILDEKLHDLNSVSNNHITYEYLSDVKEIPKLSVILPERESGELKNVKHVFKGSLIVNEGLSMVNLDSEIKMELDDSSCEDQNGKSISSCAKTSVNSEMEFGKLISPDVEELKRHKKNRNSQGKKIVKDLDDFPNCISQK